MMTMLTFLGWTWWIFAIALAALLFAIAKNYERFFAAVRGGTLMDPMPYVRKMIVYCVIALVLCVLTIAGLTTAVADVRIAYSKQTAAR
jgi:hypothetical protein